MKPTKRILALLLAVALLCGGATLFAPLASAQAMPSLPDGFTLPAVADLSTRSCWEAAFALLNGTPYRDDDVVTAIVTLAGAPASEAGERGSASVAARKKEIAGEHRAVLQQMEDAGIAYVPGAEYFSLTNGFSADVRYGDLAAIRAIPDVASVSISNTYRAPETDPAAKSMWAGDITGVNVLHAAGHDGAGVVIAVIDTGLNTDHEAFADYGLCAEALTESGVMALVRSGAVMPGRYVSAKVPFVYDYAAGTPDVTDYNGHGTHVSGIAAGYAQDEAGTVIFSGAAPAAQLVMLKTGIGATGYNSSEAILRALEDAYTLGVDVVNLSLGSTAGFSYDGSADTLLGNVYDRLREAGTMVYCSAGNEYSMAYHIYQYVCAQLVAMGYAQQNNVLPTTYTDYGVIGSPATFTGNVSVAAAFDAGTMNYALDLGGETLPFVCGTDTVHGDWFHTAFAGQTLDFVLVPGIGEPADYAALDVSGKIAVVNRGTITFAQKMEYAAAAGAVGMLIVNNVPGQRLAPGIPEPTIPCAAVSYEAGEAFAAAAASSLTVLEEQVYTTDGKGGTLCEFSSWGVANDLAFGPMITGIGGNVYSADAGNDAGYVVKSGTSMASPNVAGSAAAMLGWLREQTFAGNFTPADKQAAAELLRQMLFSTAVPSTEAGGSFVSPRKQGAGVVNVVAAASAGTYIAEPLTAAGDSEDGSFSFTLTLFNVTDADRVWRFDGASLTTDTVIGRVEGGYYFEPVASPVPEGAYQVTTDLSGGKLTVPAGGTAAVTVTLTPDPEYVEYLMEVFPYGTYLDGYFFFSEEEDPENVIHSSMIGYVGDYSAAPILETYDQSDLLDAVAFLNAPDETYPFLTHQQAGYSLEMLLSEMILGSNSAFQYDTRKNSRFSYLGGNPFGYLSVWEDRAAISTPAAAGIHLSDSVLLEPVLLRNAEHLVYIVRDGKTGKIYDHGDDPYIRKSYFYTEENPHPTFSGCLWDGADHSGDVPVYLPDGTEVAFEVFAFLTEEDWEGGYRSLSDFETPEAYYEALVAATGGAAWSVRAAVDLTAPEVAAQHQSGNLVLDMKDDRYLAYAELSDAEGEVLWSRTYAERDRGVSDRLVLPGGALETGAYLLALVDYATNCREYLVLVNGEGEMHVLPMDGGMCLGCSDVWTDGEALATVAHDEENGEYRVQVALPAGSAEYLASGTFAYPMDALLAKAAAAGEGVRLLLGETCEVSWDADAASQLATQTVGAFSFAGEQEGNACELHLSLGGADFSSGTATVALYEPGFAKEDLRAFYVGEDGYQPVESDYDETTHYASFQTSHFSSFLVVALDAYGHLLEDMSADAAAAQAKAEAAKAAAETAEAQAEAAQAAAETAKAQAEAEAAKAAKAEEAAQKAETAAKEAEALAGQAKAEAEALKQAAAEESAAAEERRAQAETAMFASQAARAAAKQAKAEAKEERAAAEAAKLAAEAARSAAEAALARAEQAESAVLTAKAEADAAFAAAATAKAEAEAAKSQAQKDAAQAETARIAALEEADLAAAERTGAEAALASARAALAAAEEARRLAEEAKAAAFLEKTDAVNAREAAAGAYEATRTQSAVVLACTVVSAVFAAAGALFFFLKRKR